MKYTKGPWEVNSHEHGSHKTISKGANNICIVLLGNLSDGSTGEANAHLIASSPDLLEACKAMIAVGKKASANQGYDNTPGIWLDHINAVKLIRQAIAKAERSQP